MEGQEADIEAMDITSNIVLESDPDQRSTLREEPVEGDILNRPI